MTPVRPRDVVPDDVDAPFWDACARGVLTVHRCSVCGRCYWPTSVCLDHGREPMRWVPASGRGTVHTWTVFRHVYDPELADRVPYVVAVVALEEGPFFHADLVGCAPEEVRGGLPVEVVFDRVDDDLVLPRFRPARDEPGTGCDEQQLSDVVDT